LRINVANFSGSLAQISQSLQAAFQLFAEIGIGIADKAFNPSPLQTV
jgi:hypothetical protein